MLNKSFWFYARIVLYTIAAYVVIDTLFLSKVDKKSLELAYYEKDSKETYFEIYIKKENNDSIWNAIQLAPSLRNIPAIAKISPWQNDSEFWDYCKLNNLILKGFYIDEFNILNAKSYFLIVERLDDLKTNKDKKLSSLNKNKDITFVFTKKL